MTRLLTGGCPLMARTPRERVLIDHAAALGIALTPRQAEALLRHHGRVRPDVFLSRLADAQRRQLARRPADA